MSVQNESPSQDPAPPEAAPEPNPPTDPGAASESLRVELAEIAQKADEYLRLAQRTQADFVNYRRRVEEERSQQTRDASLGFVSRLLPILDDFERATANAKPEELESSWAKGIQLVERNLRSLVAAEDVHRIDAHGAEFDPREHEAIGSQPSAEVPEGHVLHVTRPGYRKGDRTIRPAQVIVASPPATDAG